MGRWPIWEALTSMVSQVNIKLLYVPTAQAEEDINVLEKDD